MKAAEAKARRELLERANALLSGYVGARTLAKFMDIVVKGPGAAENLAKIEAYATRLLRAESDDFAALYVRARFPNPERGMMQLEVEGEHR